MRHMFRASRDRAAGCCCILLAVLLSAPALASETAAVELSDNIRVIRSWPDRAQLADRSVPTRVELVFDYEQGIAVERTLDLQGNVLEVRIRTGTVPPAKEEIALAFEIVNNDVELARQLRESNGSLDGGFILNEKKGETCGPGTRCVQVFGYADVADQHIFRSVVDLTKNLIVYRDYEPKVNRAPSVNRQGGKQ